MKAGEFPPLPDGPLTGKRIRAKGNWPDEPFACDAECLQEDGTWAVSDFGVPAGALGTIEGFDAEHSEYFIHWDDGEKTYTSGRICRYTEVYDSQSEGDLLEGAEVIG